MLASEWLGNEAHGIDPAGLPQGNSFPTARPWKILTAPTTRTQILMDNHGNFTQPVPPDRMETRNAANIQVLTTLT